MAEYRAKGYVPSSTDTTTPRGEQNQSVSRTLEYAYDDWCLGRMAQLLGKTDDAKLFFARSENYRNVFDPGVGFMRGKLPDGKWREPFSAYQLFWADYTEATAWQYSFFVPQNVPALVRLMGGDQAFAAKIDKMFTDTTPIVAAETPDITGLIGQYVQGNEPDHHVAYLYNYAGAAVEDAGPHPPGDDQPVFQRPGRAVRQRRLRPDVGVVRARRPGVLSRQPDLVRLRDRQPAGQQGDDPPRSALFTRGGPLRSSRRTIRRRTCMSSRRRSTASP